MVPADAGIWDIGANIGVTALTMASVLPNSRIVAVEGGPLVFRVLLNNITNNALNDRIVAVHSAVGEVDGEIIFCESSAYGHIANRANESTGILVPLISAPTLLREQGPVSLDFVKIDIEGSEFPFLRSGLEIFRQHRSVVCMELNIWCLMYYGKVDPIEFIEWIVANFADVRILSHNNLTDLKRLTKENQHNLLLDVMVNMKCIAGLLFCCEEGRINI